MGGSEAMAVIGIGTTSRATVDDVLAIVAQARMNADIGFTHLAALDRPAINPILAEAAFRASLEPVFFALDDLLRVADRCVTRSEKSMKHYGIPSVAEAAALAAAGPGAGLLVSRFCGRNTTASVAAVR
jgi:cobalt-precorrin 5A hydrolase